MDSKTAVEMHMKVCGKLGIKINALDPNHFEEIPANQRSVALAEEIVRSASASPRMKLSPDLLRLIQKAIEKKARDISLMERIISAIESL